MLNIGDKIYASDYSRCEKYVTCPDCFGNKYLHVILGDGNQVHIECAGCTPGGYNPPMGVIKQYEFAVQTHIYTVTGIRTTPKNIEYELDNYGGCYRTKKEDEVFKTEQEALEYGERLKAEYEDEENKRLMAKTKDGRSWAWNVSYHRSCIKKLEKEIEYHRVKLGISELNSREKIT